MTRKERITALFPFIEMRLMKFNIHNVSLTISAASSKQYPDTDWPEIALAGRSNVGKSSFINTLINRKNLARTSSEPGKTRLINFYKVYSDFDFYFVDLPGYGYSKMSKKEQEQVGKFTEEYLFKRNQMGTMSVCYVPCNAFIWLRQ